MTTKQGRVLRGLGQALSRGLVPHVGRHGEGASAKVLAFSCGQRERVMAPRSQDHARSRGS